MVTFMLACGCCTYFSLSRVLFCTSSIDIIFLSYRQIVHTETKIWYFSCYPLSYSDACLYVTWIQRLLPLLRRYVHPFQHTRQPNVVKTQNAQVCCALPFSTHSLWIVQATYCAYKNNFLVYRPIVCGNDHCGKFCQRPFFKYQCFDIAACFQHCALLVRVVAY